MVWPTHCAARTLGQHSRTIGLPQSTSRVAAALAGRYRIERELGRGGTATVYLAHDLRHARQVAIKVLYPELAASLGTDRFLREIQIASGLAHPNILALYDSGEAEGLLYYVMPYIEGESLRHRLRREIQMPVGEALRVAREVAEALAHAHRHGIVHRDVKPENILLDRDHALVADFGVARAIETASSDRLTETGLAVGTAVYMSPEQAGGVGRVDGRSDIYSLGCVLYEMLAGEPPYGGSTSQAIIAKHMQAPVPKLRVVRPAVSPSVQAIVDRALAKVSADRFTDAAAMALRLGEAAADPGPPRRRPVMLGALALLGTAGLLSIALGRWGRAPGDDEGAGETPRVAVLYLDADSNDAPVRRLADAITEELIYELSGVNALRVVSRNVVQPFRGKTVPVDSLAAALGVNTIVEGRALRWGSRLRVRVQLINARTETYVDSLSLEAPVSDSVTFARDAAQRIAAGLRRSMGREVRVQQAGAGSRSPAARDLARKAQRVREEALELADSPHAEDVATALDGLRRSDSLLARAQAVDGTWGRSWVERGWIAAEVSELSAGAARQAALEEALRLADEAARQMPDSVSPLELRGTVRARLVWELQAAPEETDRIARAETDLRTALDRDSTLVRGWETLARLLWSKGNLGEAAIAARRAMQEDTYLTEALNVYDELFFDDLMLGNFAQAREWCRRGRVAFPLQWRFAQCELTLMRHDPEVVPNPDSAWALVRALERLDPADRARSDGREYHLIYRPVVAATISALGGRPEVARAAIARARQAVRGDSTLGLDLDYDEAVLRAALGDRARARKLLAQYVAARPFARDQLARDPLLRRFGLQP
jgi:serine/threonine-protein kinase